jgi:hypothetical protein
MKTYSLAEVAAQHLPTMWKDPERWLSRRIARNELRGIRSAPTLRGPGSGWAMRESDIQYLLQYIEYHYTNDGLVPEIPDRTPAEPPKPPEPVTVADGLSARSRRRLRSA